MGNRASLAAPTKGLTRRQAIVGAGGVFGGCALGSAGVWAGAEDGVTHTADCIHQEPVFAASPKRVYEALTEAKQFTRVIQLSGALRAMHLPERPAEISRKEGGAFALFGGYITGRQVELVPNVRIVQAWPAGDWPLGRLFDRQILNSWSRVRGPRSSLTIQAFQRARRRAWLRDGKLTIGSRSLRRSHRHGEELGWRCASDSGSNDVKFGGTQRPTSARRLAALAALVSIAGAAVAQSDVRMGRYLRRPECGRGVE